MERHIDRVLGGASRSTIEKLTESKPIVALASGLVALPILYLANRLLFGKGFSRVADTQKWDWKQEIVLITGGSSGIGELAMHKLAGKGVKVVSVDLNPPKSPIPDNCRFYQLDITDPEQIRQVARQIRQDVGEPTVLINNAGVASLKLILDETDEEIRRTFDVNVVSHFFLIREFLPHMIKCNHGHIISIASMASFVTVASNVDYSCSKAAALSLHEGLLQELKYKYNARGVQSSVVHPMWIRTAMFETALKNGTLTDTLLDPQDVADAIVAHVLAGKSGQLFLPGYFSAASGLRGFPAWLQERIRGDRANLLSR